MIPIDLASKFDLFEDHWHPRVVASLNGQDVKIAQTWGVGRHAHKEDELFFVFKGEMTMHFRDRAQVVREGSMILVPRGIEHRPAVEEEAWIVLFELNHRPHRRRGFSPSENHPPALVNQVTLTIINLRWKLVVWMPGARPTTKCMPKLGATR